VALPAFGLGACSRVKPFCGDLACWRHTWIKFLRRGLAGGCGAGIVWLQQGVLPMECVFVQIRCVPGETYRVADEIVLRELHSELYSTSGEFDLLLKMYIPKEADIGLFINDNLRTIKGIERTLTTLTFKAF